MLLLFVWVVPNMLWPTAGFLFDFQPCIDVISKQTFFSLFFREMPDLMNMNYSVFLSHSFLQFGRAPGPGHLSLFFRVWTHIASFQHRFLHFCFHTGAAKRERQLVIVPERQDGMIELVGRENGAFRDTKVLENVSMSRFKDYV